eukprot:TRINITY_DN44620_c0_g1_i1.p1 TRINITY_DN44620_c0_g1~~TRINITY_DN44620_c0_g1_i1.p1  ORF type:complete len:231 (+),score=26.24 TRINITY_DN44620_c0_g1_i1:111-803(+)
MSGSWFSRGQANRQETPLPVQQLPANEAARPGFISSFMQRQDSTSSSSSNLGAALAGTGGSRTPSFMQMATASRDLAADSASTCCPALTIQQRLYGFAICFGIGLLLDLLSVGRLAMILRGKADRFAATYTLGNILTLTGTMFLAGPSRQCSRMMAEKRWVASIVFLTSMVLTLIMANSDYFNGRNLLLLLTVILQWCSLMWYVLSYIPFGRQTAASLIQRCFRCCTDSQ